MLSDDVLVQFKPRELPHTHTLVHTDSVTERFFKKSIYLVKVCEFHQIQVCVTHRFSISTDEFVILIYHPVCENRGLNRPI